MRRTLYFKEYSRIESLFVINHQMSQESVEMSQELVTFFEGVNLTPETIKALSGSF